MARASPAIASFNAGELSPYIEGRTDTEKYTAGAKRLENYLPMIQGPITRRGGRVFVTEVKDSTKRAWLVKFEFSTSQAFMLEFGDGYIRFYFNHGQVLSSGASAYSAGTTYAAGDLVTASGVTYYSRIDANVGNTPASSPTAWYAMPGSVYEIPSPYSAADLVNADGNFSLRFLQSADVLYLSHGSYAPRKLTRYAATRWIMTTLDQQGGPFKTLQTGGARITASGQTGTVSLTADQDIFAQSNVGQLLYLENNDITGFSAWASGTAYTVGTRVRSNGKTYECTVAGTSGAGAPNHTVGEQNDGNPGCRWAYRDPGYGYVKIVSVLGPRAVMALVVDRLPVDNTSTASTKTITNIVTATGTSLTVTAAAHGFTNGATAIISGVTDSATPFGGTANGTWPNITNVTTNTFDITLTTGILGYTYTSGGAAKVITTVSAVGTQRYAWGAWNSVDGYPTHIALFRERLVFARGIEVWLGVSGDYENFHDRDASGLVVTDSAFKRTLASRNVSNVLWMEVFSPTSEALMIGTGGIEYALRSQTEQQPFGPDNSSLQPVSNIGSRNITPVRVGNVILFAQRSGRKLQDLSYDYYSGSNGSNDQTLYANHMLTKQLVQIAFQQEPFSTVWALLTDGNLVAMTYSREQYANPPHGGWHRHPLLSGVVECIETMPTDTRNELWCIVRITVNGVSKRYVCYMAAEFGLDDDQEDAFFVDLGLTYSAPIQATLAPGAGATVKDTAGVPFTAGAAAWQLSDVGRYIYRRYSFVGADESGNPQVMYLTGKALITAFNSSTSVTTTITEAFPDTNVIAAGGWTMTVTSLGGLSHLEGYTVDILVDGASHPQRVVTGGAITLQDPAAKVQIGLPMPARVQTLRLNAGAQDGTSQGKKGRIPNLALRLLRTLGQRIGSKFTDMFDLDFREPANLMDNPVPLFTGDVPVDFPGDWNTNPWICLEQKDPLPSTIVGIYPQVIVSDKD